MEEVAQAVSCSWVLVNLVMQPHNLVTVHLENGLPAPTILLWLPCYGSDVYLPLWVLNINE